jgi:tRNA threonylcarbamoyladenosine biosynthesis protein TsaE
MNTTEPLRTHTPEETQRVAGDLLARLPGAHGVIALYGDLGAGKTCFVQGLARAAGFEGSVTSPTYTLANEYAGATRIIHVDLYRVRNEEEAFRLGLEDYLDDPQSLVVIEWADRAEALLPPQTLRVYVAHGAGPDERIIRVVPAG